MGNGPPSSRALPPARRPGRSAMPGVRSYRPPALTASQRTSWGSRHVSFGSVIYRLALRRRCSMTGCKKDMAWKLSAVSRKPAIAGKLSGTCCAGGSSRPCEHAGPQRSFSTARRCSATGCRTCLWLSRIRLKWTTALLRPRHLACATSGPVGESARLTLLDDTHPLPRWCLAKVVTQRLSASWAAKRSRAARSPGASLVRTSARSKAFNASGRWPSAARPLA
jgi:hypothetical protein